MTNQGIIKGGSLTQVDTVAQNRLGTRSWDEAGNQYIYLKGVASVVRGSVVVFDEEFETLLASTTNNIGMVAVAMSAVVADRYGWFQVGGRAVAKVLASFANNSKVFITATAGSVDDSGAAGDQIVGAYGRSAIDTPETGFAYLQLNGSAVVGVNVA